MPDSYAESLLGRYEKIIMVSRQHWMMLVANIIGDIILVFLIFIVTLLLAYFIPSSWTIIILIGFLIMLIPAFFMLRGILRYVNHQYIITNRRVIQISGMYNKSVIDSSLEKVNDVKMDQSVLGRLMDYGNIEILTASELGVNIFKRIEHPVQFKTAMLDAKEQSEHETSSPALPGQAPTLLIQLDELYRNGILTEQEYSQKKQQILERIK